MKYKQLEKLMHLSQDVGHVFIATANRDGEPHMAVAGSLIYRSDSQIEIDEWFCPQTLANLESAPLISIAIWDPEADEGMQLTGSVSEIRDQQILNGYGPDAQEQGGYPQAKKQLVVDVVRIREFSIQPHTDEPVVEHS
ncbi:MAG: pyridoxamine 5'-phosphate oxidase family protein [Chitinivibrionales bacterium]